MLAFHRVAGERKLLLGMVHLLPLPGAPRWGGRLDDVVDRAVRDAHTLLEAGFDGWIVENFGDAPFFRDRVPAHVLTVMTRVALALPRDQGVLTGANVLRNDAHGALAVALAADLDLVRVNVHVGVAATDQGFVEGRAAETLRERALLGAPVAVLADVEVKHASPVASRHDLAESAREAAERGLADGLIVTGRATGSPAALSHARAVKEAAPDVPLLVGSGVTAETLADVLTVADGVIVGTSLKERGDVRRPVDPARARDFASAR